MAKKSTSDPAQLTLLTFEELDQKLIEEPNKLHRLEIRPEDVGGELLSILSKGLYTNPLDCIREYVQNSVDAKSPSVTIKITGNSVAIFDDGNGMNLQELVQARQFGLSGKSIKENVGFRGIGIYSGFDLCKRLRITTKKAGEAFLNVLVFNFDEMRIRLDADKRDGNDQKTSLFELLSQYTEIGREMLPASANVDRHFTIAQLEDINDVHIRELSNRGKMRAYLLQNLPIDFADDFEHKETINALLYEHVNGYSAIKITLQSDGLPDEVVAKEAIPSLQIPSCGYIETTSGHRVAYYWACLNKERDRINKNTKIKNEDKEKSEETTERTSYEGFVYKVRGFTIGDRQKLRTMFERKPQLYPWYTGEIYVLDTNIIPNAERNDFETNQAKRALSFAVQDKLSALETVAEDFQAKGVAHERIGKYVEEVRGISEKVTANTQGDDFEVFSRLNAILKDLGQQKSKADTENKKSATTLIDQAKSLQQRLRKEADNPSTEATRKQKAAKSSKVTNREQVPQFATLPLVPSKTLHEVFSDAGWAVEGQLARIIEVIQGSLEDVLPADIYRRLTIDIEAKLTSNVADE